MSYRATDDSTSQSNSERVAEAKRIYYTMGLMDRYNDMTKKEQEFLDQLAEGFDGYSDVTVSVKQLWWLRDLKDKYL